MKKKLNSIVLYGVIVILLIACNKAERINRIPSCKITKPKHGARIQSGTADSITVVADDIDGYIFEVLYYVDDSLIGNTSNLQHKINWTAWREESGISTIRVKATDNEGGSVIDEIQVYIEVKDINIVSGSITDYDGNIYKTVTIGEQEWMAENLNVTHYKDGTEISLVEDKVDWVALGNNTIDDAYCYYNNDNNSQYGALYTYAAAINACPSDWHLPSNEDWETLIQYIESDGFSDVGKAMKGKIWIDGERGTDNYGFSALPGGFRSSTDGTFYYEGAFTSWWSSTPDDSDSVFTYTYSLSSNNNAIKSISAFKSIGYSVRCIKD